MAFKYARTGPPFNFLGTLTESQKEAFEKWVAEHKPNFDPISKFHRVRAHQLRKASGILEEFYKSKDPRGLKATMEKAPWQPDQTGHWVQTQRDDHLPANTMAVIKDRFQEQLALDDEAVFRMNYVRHRFEVHEDLAQDNLEAPGVVEARLADLNRYFSEPHFQGALVRDKSDTFKGEPRFRVHPLDPPTAWERQTSEQMLLES